jgi:hypothetical protein
MIRVPGKSLRSMQDTHRRQETTGFLSGALEHLISSLVMRKTFGIRSYARRYALGVRGLSRTRAPDSVSPLSEKTANVAREALSTDDKLELRCPRKAL